MVNNFFKVTGTALLLAATAYSQKMPFPQAKDYPGCIKPSISQATLNADVQNAYDNYKDKFLKEAKSTLGGYYIYSEDTDEGWNVVTVSEAHGWGMVITAMMAGYDKDAKKIFDGLFAFYKDHKQAEADGNNLMAWRINGSSTYEDTKATDAATDGDMDVAYGLLLAYKQWGEAEYLSTAKAIIADIYSYETNHSTHTTTLGNWATSDAPEYNYTRPSDWIGDHMRDFATVTGNSSWNTIANTSYTIYNKLQEQDYVKIPLVPDFIQWDGSTADAAAANFLESEHDGDFYTNAARVPWRVATDYAMSGNSGAKAMLDKINAWVITKTSGHVENFNAGYYMDGASIATYQEAAFTAPIVAAQIAGGNQQFLTDGWNYLQQDYMINDNDAYNEAIRLQSMLLMSGNWWGWNDAPADTTSQTLTGLNVIPYVGWEPNTDSKSTVQVTLDSTAGKVSKVSANIDRAAFSNDTAYDTYASLDGYFDGNLSGLTEVGITYSSDKPIKVILPMTGVTDESGAAHYTTLAATGGSEKTEKLPIDLFAQPSWTEDTDKADLDLAKVNSISFEIDDEGAGELKANFSFTNLVLTGASIDTTNSGGSGDTTVVDTNTIDGTNVLAYISWEDVKDDIGSKVEITLDKDGDSVKTVTAKIDRAAFSNDTAYDAYASLTGYFDASTLAGVDSVSITYTSDKDLLFSLPMDGTADTASGAAHSIILKAGNNKVVTVPISQFIQPDWTEKADSVKWDASKVTSISFEESTDSAKATTVNFTITSIIFDGASIKATPIISNSKVITSAGLSQVMSNAGMVKANLSLPQATNMNLVIVNTQGRVIAKESLALKAGLSTISVDMNSNARGVYYLVAKGGAYNFIQKFILQ